MLITVTGRYKPLTNRVRGPYRKLRTEFFLEGEKRGPVTYSRDRENEVRKIFIISLVCVWRAQERFLFTRNGFKFLTHLESKTSQFEINFKSLARFNTQFRVKKGFKRSCQNISRIENQWQKIETFFILPKHPFLWTSFEKNILKFQRFFFRLKFKKVSLWHDFYRRFYRGVFCTIFWETKWRLTLTGLKDTWYLNFRHCNQTRRKLIYQNIYQESLAVGNWVLSWQLNKTWCHPSAM